MHENSVTTDRTRQKQLAALEEQLGYCFANGALLEEALTHASYAREHGSSVFNQRLEFLGDAVLGLVSGEMLYEVFSEYDEGKLTRIRSQLVRGTTLVAWAKEIGLGKLIKIGRSRKGEVTDSMLEDAAEAVFGALFADSDYETARKVALKFFSWRLEEALEDTLDPKTELQELTQADGSGRVPHYTTVKRPQPGSDSPFVVFLYIGDEKISEGFGKNIKEAEFAAAKRALRKLTKK